MALPKRFLSLLVCLFASLPLSCLHVHGSDELKAFIVHVKRPENLSFSVAEQWAGWYSSLLSLASLEANATDFARSRVIHSYRHVATGFSALLTEREVEAMSKLGWFLHAYPSPVYHLMTTHSPKFLGLRRRIGNGVWSATNRGEGVIVGILDTGVTPGHPSFDDHGLPPPPAKWKGRCDLNASACNNKLIGARGRPTDTPIDDEGHGTHTASTAAGAFVKHADVNGNARGVAAGVAPRAHIAVYKVCSETGCAGYDILAAMDAAVDDGVDVLSLSLGGGSVPFHSDPVALAGFEAINRGVFVSCSAGNSGPDPYTVTNTAPWLLTVGASTMDRSFLGTVKLGDGQEWEGASLYPPRNFDAKMLPLVYAAGLNDSLNGVDVRGKIVLCDRGDNSRLEKAEVVKSAGGAGVILVNTPEDAYSTVADPLVLPASNVPYVVGLKIKAYINSTSAPEASLVFNGTVMHTPHSPSMASFSSRGPSQITPGILKPDITGPGVSILAAWTMQKFNMISGTSMSCPHLSGIAALIRKANPDWSPAAIKSAIMTTAYVTDNSRGPILDERHLPADFFAIGAGHVNPPKAIDPGLVYDLTPQDYIPYLCGLYESYLVEVIVGRPVDCSSPKSIREGELNYPSISLTLPANNLKSVRYRRTVTNVGEPTSTYRVKLDVPQEVSATVTPTRLSFDELNQKQSFSISFRRNGGGSGAVQGQLLWVSTKHVVRSPISIRLE
ncbi:subtilisin-like protease [Musa troglodytarum]|uniref:Subtilisin-like protease n=1 Tax=Musa troglodytarum TaxID=320322 RepID=A0A9E7EL24_9LILI|nr:subtilisin-like protease [Musa troglodytarum]